MSIGDALLDPDVYSSPKQFNPERWLTADPTDLKKMNAAFVSFHAGSRICIGIKFVKPILFR